MITVLVIIGMRAWAEMLSKPHSGSYQNINAADEEQELYHTLRIDADPYSPGGFITRLSAGEVRRKKLHNGVGNEKYLWRDEDEVTRLVKNNKLEVH